MTKEKYLFLGVLPRVNCHSLWKMYLYFLPDDTPMWVGWNANIRSEDETCQKIYYLPQIDMSPTCNSVVVETLNIAKRIADECGKDEICVTYDLAIAKIAMQIQAEESPNFDGDSNWSDAEFTQPKIFSPLQHLAPDFSPLFSHFRRICSRG